MIEMGFIGVGYWGPNLVRNFSKFKEVNIKWICDLDSERLENIKRLYPATKVTKYCDEVIEDPDLDAVVIATPVAFHYPLTKKALLNNKHVLVTKPMATAIEEAVELVKLSEEKNRVLMVDHTFIYSGPVIKIKELINNGEIGIIYTYDSVRINLGLFQKEVNVVWDLAVHDFSILLYLFDKMPTYVSCIGTKPSIFKDYNHESIAYVTLTYDDGFLAHMHVSWLSPLKVRRTLIGGSKKMIVYDHLDSDNQIKIYDKGVEFRPHTPGKEEDYKLYVQYRTGDMYAPKVDQTEALEIEAREFIDSIMGKTRPKSDGYHGLRVVEILTAAQKSLERKGEVVKIEYTEVPVNSPRC